MDKGSLPEIAGFPARLTYYRQRAGLTQAELARRARDLLPDGNSFNRASISRYEKGDNVPRRDALEALAKVLSVTVEELAPGNNLPRTVARHLTMDPAFGTASPAMMLLEAESGMARLTVNNVQVPFSVAMQIMELLKAAREVAPTSKPDPVEKKES